MGWLKEILGENRRTVASWPEWKRRVGMNETMGRPYQVQVTQLQAENAQLKAELAQCHADKDEMVKRNKLLRDRPDLPLERLAAYDEIMNQLAQATQREARLREELKSILELGRKDLSNSKYDGYFEDAKQALEEVGA